MRGPARLIVITAVCLSWPLLTGADGCPLNQSNDSEAPPVAQGLDLGGASGAMWQIEHEEKMVVTLRAGRQVDAQEVGVGGVVTLLGQTIDVSTFCWRTDALCPQQVLPADMALVQPDAPGYIVVGFNRRGPLQRIARQVGLVGRINGRELAVPLAVGEAARGFCALAQSSEIRATAYVDDAERSDAAAQDDVERATRLRGRVTVAFGGDCLTLGGNAAADAEAVIEISVGFAATRR